MPKKNSTRSTSLWGEKSDPIITDFCDRHGLTKAGALEVLILGIVAEKELVTEEIEMAIIATGKSRRVELNPDLRKVRGAALLKLAKIPSEELDELLALRDRIQKNEKEAQDQE